jgi:hypothetical protein
VRPTLLQAIDHTLGLIATREFGLQYYVLDDALKPALRETSYFTPSRGVLNSAFNEMQNEPMWIKALKRLRRSQNAEGGHIQLDRRALAIWLCLKINAEYQTLVKLESVIPRESNQLSLDEWFYRTTSEMIQFVSRHTLVKPRETRVAVLAERLVTIGKTKATDVLSDEHVEALCSLDANFLYFFYCHGN